MIFLFGFLLFFNIYLCKCYVFERFGFEYIQDLIFKIHLVLKLNTKCSMNNIE